MFFGRLASRKGGSLPCRFPKGCRLACAGEGDGEKAEALRDAACARGNGASPFRPRWEQLVQARGEGESAPWLHGSREERPRSLTLQPLWMWKGKNGSRFRPPLAMSPFPYSRRGKVRIVGASSFSFLLVCAERTVTGLGWGRTLEVSSPFRCAGDPVASPEAAARTG